MEKKHRLKPLSLYGLDLKGALHVMLSVDPRKLKLQEEETEEPSKEESKKPSRNKEQ